MQFAVNVFCSADNSAVMEWVVRESVQKRINHTPVKSCAEQNEGFVISFFFFLKQNVSSLHLPLLNTFLVQCLGYLLFEGNSKDFIVST